MLDILNQPYVLQAILTVILVSLTSGGLGCIIIWQRMAFFGDSVAHSSVLGVSLGLLLGVSLQLSVILTCVIFAVIFLWLQKQRSIPSDTTLGIMAHFTLALGIIIVGITQNNFNSHQLLFGELLLLSNTEVMTIGIVSLLTGIILIIFWQQIILSIIQVDLAQAEGIPAQKLHNLIILLISCMIATTIQAFGVLLITSIMIIPAATASHFAKSPSQMAIIATVLSIFSGCWGIIFSLYFDTPTGPTIIVTAGCLFFTAVLLSALFPSITPSK